MPEPILTHDQYEDFLENGLPDEDQSAYLARITYCPAKYPLTGHQCELSPGHAGHHDRIIAGKWVRWCDHPDTCEDLTCDIAKGRP